MTGTSNCQLKHVIHIDGLISISCLCWKKKKNSTTQKPPPPRASNIDEDEDDDDVGQKSFEFLANSDFSISVGIPALWVVPVSGQGCVWCALREIGGGSLYIYTPKSKQKGHLCPWCLVVPPLLFSLTWHNDEWHLIARQSMSMSMSMLNVTNQFSPTGGLDGKTKATTHTICPPPSALRPHWHKQFTQVGFLAFVPNWLLLAWLALACLSNRQKIPSIVS